MSGTAWILLVKTVNNPVQLPVSERLSSFILMQIDATGPNSEGLCICTYDLQPEMGSLTVSE